MIAISITIITTNIIIAVMNITISDQQCSCTLSCICFSLTSSSYCCGHFEILDPLIRPTISIRRVHLRMTFLMKTRLTVPWNWRSTFSGKVCWLKYRYGSQIDSVNKYIPAHYCSNKFGWFYLQAVDNVDWDDHCVLWVKIKLWWNLLFHGWEGKWG